MGSPLFSRGHVKDFELSPTPPLSQEAVDAALHHSDVVLAKRSACKPPPTQKRLRQKLWLRIVEHEAWHHS